MPTPPASPRRRHILSSINPDEDSTRRKRKSPTPADPTPERDDPTPTEGHDEARRTKIRFKSKHSRSHRPRDDSSGSHHEHRDHRHHRHRGHHHRRRRSATPPNPHDPPPLDPEAAFRESLFDAMADDEGAAYWEGVYGQPVHVYPNEKVGPAGELERMTDDEYATYVRQRMWEKTHQGLLEERARREERRRREEEEEAASRKLREDMERSLRRGEQRRLKKMWSQRWDEYRNAWAGWDGAIETIPWPVETGRRSDVGEKEVRRFFVNGLDLDEVGQPAFAARVKEERVRWHPDKMQQRFGGRANDEIMKDVTAIFQMIDKLWADTRSQA